MTRLRWLTLPLLRTACALAVLAPSVPGPAAAQAAAEQDYDLPGQALGEALKAVAALARVSIVFEPGVTSRHRSEALQGRFTPQVAVQRLLAGTGLTVRFTGPRSAIIFDPKAAAVLHPSLRSATGAHPTVDLDLGVVRAARVIGQGNHAALSAYALRAERLVQTVFAQAPAYQGTPFSIRIAIRIDGAGRIEQAELLRPSGHPALDAAAVQTILGHKLDAPPPAGLRQPLRFDVAGAAAGPRR